MTPDVKDVSLREIVQAMAKSPDSEVFRWFQDSYVGSDGRIQAGVTMRLTLGQLRKELAP